MEDTCFSQKQRFEVKIVLMDLLQAYSFSFHKMLMDWSHVVDYCSVLITNLDSHSDGTQRSIDEQVMFISTNLFW